VRVWVLDRSDRAAINYSQPLGTEKGKGFTMNVSYTITPEAYAEDGERSDTLHQCPLCGIEYDISEHAEWSPNGLDYNESGDWIGLRWGHHVTANCDCHDKHVAENNNRKGN
jgi:hypothetical protein